MTEQVVQAILAAAGELGTISPEAREDGPYTILGELARNIVLAAREHDRPGFEQVFNVVEQNLASASAETRDLLVVGFLEDLQNISLNRGIPLDTWTAWFGGHTAEAWEVVKRMWQGGVTPDAFRTFITSGVSPG